MELKYSWWEYFIIPWVAAFIGYITNVVALYMTFYPIDYWGVEWFRLKNEPWGLFGWQGIIPTKAEKMAIISFDMFTKKLFKLKDLFDRLDPVRFSEVMSDSILLLMDEILNEVAMQYMPSVWEGLPQAVKDDIVVMAEQEGQLFIAEFMIDMKDKIDDVVDVKQFTVEACVANRALVVQIFQECGEQEFIFIRRSGFYFGFLFGIVQMGFWMLYPAWWTLPTAGFIVGWFTNYLALKVIFSPLEPIKFGPWILHGLFLKRQKEVSAVFARVVMSEIVNVRTMWESVFTGPLSKNFFAMLRAHTLVFTEKLLVEVRPIAIAAMGADTFAQMKEDIAQKVADRLPGIIDNSFEYTQEALDMENSVREKMQELSSQDFERVLHPAFEEDEIQLIVLGGILGAIVGFIQLFTVF